MRKLTAEQKQPTVSEKIVDCFCVKVKSTDCFWKKKSIDFT